jgi:YHS domain-containing protein
MMVKDVVCGLIIDSTTAAGRSEFEGETYYFCSRGCKAEFDKTLLRPAPRRTRNKRDSTARATHAPHTTIR